MPIKTTMQSVHVLNICLGACRNWMHVAANLFPNTMRWFNTILSHPHVSQYAGPLTPPPVKPTPSSSAANQPQPNGIPKQKQADHASTSQAASKPTTELNGQQAQSGKADQKQSMGKGDGQQDKPKGKDAKGGKLAKERRCQGAKEGRRQEGQALPSSQGCCLVITANTHVPAAAAAAAVKAARPNAAGCAAA